MSGRGRRKGRDDAVCESRGHGQREGLAPQKRQWRERMLRILFRAKEAERNRTEGSGGWCLWQHGRRGSGCASRSASVTAASPPGGPGCGSTSPARGS
eukprot:4316746-Pleurochrysis_carterae.AAC.1